ncbi:unnamed protein product, partial [Discosporangium mesarthrocarpum]
GEEEVARAAPSIVVDVASDTGMGAGAVGAGPGGGGEQRGGASCTSTGAGAGADTGGEPRGRYSFASSLVDGAALGTTEARMPPQRSGDPTVRGLKGRRVE